MSKQTSRPDRLVSKMYAVPIAKMRVPPADLVQRPFIKGHADALDADFDIDKVGVLTVNHRDGVFWVIDGQHRLSVLKRRGFAEERDTWMCQVYEGLTDEESASLFLGLNNRKAVGTFTKFNIACKAGDPMASSIRRAIESQGLKVSREQEVGCVAAVVAAGKVWQLAGGGSPGEVLLGTVMRIIRDAYDSDSAAFDGVLIHALGLVLNRYAGRVSEKSMIDRLGATSKGHRRLMQLAEQQRTRTGSQKVQCLAAVIVDDYNRVVARGSKLPSWWREAEA